VTGFRTGQLTGAAGAQGVWAAVVAADASASGVEVQGAARSYDAASLRGFHVMRDPSFAGLLNKADQD